MNSKFNLPPLLNYDQSLTSLMCCFVPGLTLTFLRLENELGTQDSQQLPQDGNHTCIQTKETRLSAQMLSCKLHYRRTNLQIL